MQNNCYVRYQNAKYHYACQKWKRKKHFLKNEKKNVIHQKVWSIIFEWEKTVYSLFAICYLD